MISTWADQHRGQMDHENAMLLSHLRARLDRVFRLPRLQFLKEIRQVFLLPGEAEPPPPLSARDPLQHQHSNTKLSLELRDSWFYLDQLLSLYHPAFDWTGPIMRSSTHTTHYTRQSRTCFPSAFDVKTQKTKGIQKRTRIRGIEPRAGE